MDTDVSRIIEFCNDLYSSYAPFKNRHLRTLSTGGHNMYDEVNDDLYKWADQLLEITFGIVGRPDEDPVVFKKVYSDDLNEILKVLESKAKSLRDSLSEDRFIGVINVLEDVISGLNQWFYMIQMS